jgi:outer membrane protein
MQKTFLACALALTLAAAATPVLAQSKGDWTLGVGVHAVDPKSGNGRLAGGTLPVRVDTDVKPTLTFEYFVRDNLGVEVIAAWPFEHDISIAGLGTVNIDPIVYGAAYVMKF